MPKLCDNDDVPTDSQPSTCQFCKCDTVKLYCCPKCSAFYCSLKCYKSKQHAKCSEQFYKDQVEITVDGNIKPEVKVDERLKTATSFEDYMKKMKDVDSKKTEEEINPQLEAEEDEELLFDSDEEPEYLSKILDKTVADYEKEDVEDINVKLMKAGIGSLLEDDDEQMEKLYSMLNDDEKKAFTRLAEKMHYDEIGISNSCFKKPK
uniref:HIT-type domain-containing protein n=1 Tax=Panagrolaimus davidi TaxID=227884 RepID=A0A914P7Y5_9BILA